MSYKIFIDTNIYLDFYRSNNKDSINDIIKELDKYKKFLLCTEQSDDEFFRNRDKIINEFIDTLNKQRNTLYDSNFISTLDYYSHYASDIKKANNSIKIMIDKCKELVDSMDKDPVYILYSEFRNNMYLRTDDIITKAIKRKYIGNPPVSKKATCCDEIIWETLLYYSTDNLIIVSRDGTFKENSNFLCNEYKRVTGKELLIVESISDAIRINGDIPSEELEDFETNIMLEKDLVQYGILKENSNWVNIIYNSLISLGGEAELKDIYTQVSTIVDKRYPEKRTNKDIEATIRGILQRYSSDTESFNNKFDLFKQIRRGKWSIRNIKQN